MKGKTVNDHPQIFSQPLGVDAPAAAPAPAAATPPEVVSVEVGDAQKGTDDTH